MALVAVFVVALAGWLILTGRLQKMTGKDGIMLGIALVGAILAAKGKPIIGGIPIVISALYAYLRIAKPMAGRRATPPAAPPSSVSESDVAMAREILGLGPDADADAIRAAHRRLIARAHPDQGGTEALARQVNAARDILLRHDSEQ